MKSTNHKTSKPKLIVIVRPLKKAHAMTRKARSKAAPPKTAFPLKKAHNMPPRQSKLRPFEQLVLELAATRKTKRTTLSKSLTQKIRGI